MIVGDEALRAQAVLLAFLAGVDWGMRKAYGARYGDVNRWRWYILTGQVALLVWWGFTS